MSKAEFSQLEKRFPQRSGRVFSEARKAALEAGHAVLVVRGRNLVRVFPDGKVLKMKTLEARRRVPKGRKIAITKLSN